MRSINLTTLEFFGESRLPVFIGDILNGYTITAAIGDAPDI